MSAKKRVLVLSHDKVGDRMAGPGIRYHFVAETLAKQFDVTLGVFNPSYVSDHNQSHSYATRPVDVHNFQAAFDQTDYIFTLWLSSEMLAYANRQRKIIIFDVYCPVPVENLVSKLFSGKGLGEYDDAEFAATVERYKDYFRYGDLFVFSNLRQQDFWTGFVFGGGLISPRAYAQAPAYDKLALAPMGVNLAEELTHTKAVLRGTMGNIKDNDFLLVWTGGIWDWFDALTVIRAMGKLKDHEDIKLVFLGTKHPNDEVPAMAETDEARKLARELGMLDKTVYFRDGWIDYAERINYLLEADAAIYAHKPSIEARFSHRTRVLDHILAGLPTIATEGDYFADLVRDEGLGLAVVPGDVNAMAEAILNLRRPETMKAVHEQLAKVKPDFGWDKVLGPLVQYIERTDPKDKQPVPEHRPMVRPAVYRAARRVLPFRVRRVILRAVRMFQQ